MAEFQLESYVIRSEFQEGSLQKALYGKIRGSDLFQARSPNDHCVWETGRGVLSFLRQKRRWKDAFSFS